MRSSVSARQPVNQIVGISDYFIITFFLYVLPVYASFFTPSCLTVIQTPEEQAGCCMWSKAESVLWPRPSFGVTDSLLCESPPLLVLVWVQESHLQIAIINLTLWWCHHAWLIELGSTLSTFWPIVSETIPHGAPGTSFARWFIWTGI